MTSLLLTSCFAILEARDNAALDAVAVKVTERISLGMDINEAIDILTKEKFVVTEKLVVADPDFDHQKMYKVGVNLRGLSPIPMFAIIRYTLDIPSRQKPYINITASLDGKIVRISRDP